jgi:hypothetical protein
MEDKMMEATIEDKKKSEHLTEIYLLMGKHVFGYRMAASIVGGRARLDRLIGEGRVMAEKRSSSQNGKWYCNAAQVLYYAKRG